MGDAIVPGNALGLRVGPSTAAEREICWSRERGDEGFGGASTCASWMASLGWDSRSAGGAIKVFDGAVDAVSIGDAKRAAKLMARASVSVGVFTMATTLAPSIWPSMMGMAMDRDAAERSRSFLRRVSFSDICWVMIGHYPFLEVGAGDAGDAGERGLDAELADSEDALGVGLGAVAEEEDFFVAGTFALLDELGFDPPHQWVEPEDGLDEHVEEGGEVVAAADVGGLVGEDGFEVGVVEVGGDGLGPEEDGADDAEDAGLHGAGLGLG